MSYDAVVNKNDINMKRLASTLSDRKAHGWQLAAIFEQAGNTIQVFETNTVLQQLLAEQKRTNQLLEWLGQLLSKQQA
jgi:hypothetical protein